MTEHMAGRLHRRPPQGRSHAGMVTVETAVVLPVLVAAALLLAWVLSLAVTQVVLVDAAREAARMTARGDSVEAAEQTALKVAPEGARVTVDESAGVVSVRVDLTVGPDLPLIGAWGSVDLHAESVSVAEQTAGRP